MTKCAMFGQAQQPSANFEVCLENSEIRRGALDIQCGLLNTEELRPQYPFRR